MAEYTEEKIAEWQLRNKVLTGLIKRCGDRSRDLVDRVHHEMETIIARHECKRYLDLAEGKENDGISLQESLVAYCLGITDEFSE